MRILDDFSERYELPYIPSGPGLIVIEDEYGTPLQVVRSQNLRRRIGELFDNEGHIAVHGPKIYKAQQTGQRIFVRWKHGEYSEPAKRDLAAQLHLAWDS